MAQADFIVMHLLILKKGSLCLVRLKRNKVGLVMMTPVYGQCYFPGFLLSRGRIHGSLMGELKPA